MAGPKTLGGWVVVNHGVRKWWHVQRILMTWGLCQELADHDVNMSEVAAFSVDDSTFYRSLKVYREVFPELEPADLWARLRAGVEGKASEGSVADAVQLARVSGLGLAL